MHNIASLLNVESLISSGGILLIAAIVFAESGLLVGFFLPGDTLLFSAGLFAAQGKLPLAPLLVSLVAAAILGDNVGYSLGRRTGHRIFRKQDGILFRQEYLTRAEQFYEAHGGKTIILARFVPIVRTFAPVVAGAAKMPRQRFMLFNIIGGLTWSLGVTMLGYTLGASIPNVEKYVAPVMLLAVLITFGPATWHIVKEKDTRDKIVNLIKRQFRKISSLIRLNKK